MKTKEINYLSGFIAAACVIIFYPVLKSDFMGYDDPYYVLDNHYLKEFTFKNIAAIFSGKAIDLYVPVTLISYLIEYSLFGPNAKEFHVMNLLLHILNSILLLRILIALDLKNKILIYLLLLFFAVHPLVCESVCWISERKDVLYTFFFFLSILQFLKYNRSKRKKNNLLSLIYFLLACLSKPMAISLPVLFFIYWIYVRQKLTFKKWLFLFPFFVISILTALISIFSIKNAAVYKLPDYSFLEKTILLLSELGYYFFKPFFPVYQQLINPFPVKNTVLQNDTIVLFAFAGLALFAAALHSIFKTKDRLITFLFISWLVFLMPVLQLYPNTHSYVSERYFYISIIFPPAIIYCYLQKYQAIQKKLVPASLLLFIVFAVLCFNRSRYWINTKTLFTQELKIDENDARALNNLGFYYNSVQDYKNGCDLLHKAILIDNQNEIYLNNYGWALSGLNKTDSAIVVFNMALHKKPDYVSALNNLGVCYCFKKNWSQAYLNFSRAYRVDPMNNETLFNLGLYHISVGEKETGTELMKKAFALGNEAAAKYLK